MNYKKTVEQLKRLTVSEKDFSVSAKYFFDHIAESPLLNQKSKPYKKQNDFYKALLTPVLESYDDGTITIEGFYLMHIKKSCFVHGVAQLSRRVVLLALYFFEDIQMGMAIISNLSSGGADYYRLTTFTSTRGPDEVILPTDLSKSKH